MHSFRVVCVPYSGSVQSLRCAAVQHQLVGTTRCSAASRSMRHRARLASAWHAA